MGNTKEEFNPAKTTSARVAEIVVADTIVSQNGNRKYLSETLELLKGPDGDDMTQYILQKYCGVGVEGSFDKRVLELCLPLNITADQLKKEMTVILEGYCQSTE